MLYVFVTYNAHNSYNLSLATRIVHKKLRALQPKNMKKLKNVVWNSCIFEKKHAISNNPIYDASESMI